MAKIFVDNGDKLHLVSKEDYVSKVGRSHYETFCGLKATHMLRVDRPYKRVCGDCMRHAKRKDN